MSERISYILNWVATAIVLFSWLAVIVGSIAAIWGSKDIGLKIAGTGAVLFFGGVLVGLASSSTSPPAPGRE